MFSDEKLKNGENCLRIGPAPKNRKSVENSDSSLIPNRPTIAQVISNTSNLGTLVQPIKAETVQQPYKILYQPLTAQNIGPKINGTTAVNNSPNLISPPKSTPTPQQQRTLNIGGKSYNIKSVHISPSQMQQPLINTAVQKSTNGIAMSSNDKNVYYIKG